MDTMQAIIHTDPQDPTALAWQTTALPQLKEGEVLLKIAAAGVNRGDVLQAAGHYPPPQGASEIIGLEAAGVIEQFGPGINPETTEWSLGDHCGALLAGGGYAEYAAVPIEHLTPVPQGWSLAETASIVEVATTVWSNLGMIANIKKGQTVLIHGGSGGIGTFAIQLAHTLGLTVATTAGSKENLQKCKDLGADILINYKEDDFVAIMKDHGGADAILDVMGAKYLESNVKALGEQGHLIIIGLQGGIKGELNINRLLTKRGSITATSLRGRTNKNKAEIVASTVKTVWPLLADGSIKPQISTTLPIEQAARAHEMLKNREVTGKIVLEVGSFAQN